MTLTLKLEDKAKLYFFSDGFKHQFDADNQKKFSRKRLLNIFTYSSNFPMEEQQELLEFALEDWKGETKQTDDVSLIGVQF